MRLLVIEDDENIARFLQKGLREEGFAVDVARDGEEGAHLAREVDYDLITLDVQLPKRDGFEVLRDLRSRGVRSRILMLTVRGAVEDSVRGLEGGADDYLKKPFAFAELLARIRALLRRNSQAGPSILTAQDLVMDLRMRKVTRAGEQVMLSAKELAVLEYLLRHPGEVISRTRLAEHAWDENFDAFSNVIDVTVYRLREKIDRDNPCKLIHTVRGSGYVLRPG